MTPAELELLDDDLRRLERQHALLRLPSFGAEEAWALGCRLREASGAAGHAMVIEVRLARRTVFYSSMPGSTAVNEDWARRKRNTAELFEQSSYRVGRGLLKEGTTLEAQMAARPSDFAAHGGAVPILLRDGTCVGCATVSGIPQRADHALVVAALAEACVVALEDVALR